MTQSVTLLQLYPKDMNIYGDWGNVLCLKRRLEWRGYEVNLIEYNPGDQFPDTVDIVVGGGGQDSGQTVIQDDLQKIAPKLRDMAVDGTPMLVICGLYQLFGHFFKTKDDVKIPGIGILDVKTYGGSERMIGNILTNSHEFGKIIGYENHSGQTRLKDSSNRLATVEKGAGNNGKDGTEGARYNNVMGSYLHGSLLPKNPQLADWLILVALKNKYGTTDLMPIDDDFAEKARAEALNRPR